MKKHDSLFKSTIIVSFLVISSKLLGFGREALIAAYYGATAETDAFFFAQNMPLMIFPAVCNSVSTAFVLLQPPVEYWKFVEKAFHRPKIMVYCSEKVTLSCFYNAFAVPARSSAKCERYQPL